MAESRGEGKRPDRAGTAARADASGASFIDQIVKDPRNPPKMLLLTGYLGRSSEEGHTRLYLDPELSDYVEIPNDAILHAEPTGEESSLAGTYVWIARSAEVVHGQAGATRYKASFLEGRITQDYMNQAAGGGLGTAGVGGAGGAGGAAAFAPYTIPFPICNPTQFPPYCPPSIPLWRCPTRFYPLCRSVVVVQCPSVVWCRPSVPSYRCPSVAINCPTRTGIGCTNSSLVVCQSVAVRCPVASVVGCPQPSAVVQCPTFGACPSAIDACPSAPGGCTFDPTIFQTPVVNPGGFEGGGLAGGGMAGGFGMFGGGGGFGFGG